MSAGTAVTHAELNLSDKPVQLYQIWIMPREMERKPRYVQKDFSRTTVENYLLPVASGFGPGGALEIETDAVIYISELQTGQELGYSQKTGFGVFVYITKGQIQINEESFQDFDQARITDEPGLVITAQTNAKFILIEVKL